MAVAERRVLGIDLGVTSAHTVAILDQAGQVLGRRRCRPTVESLKVVHASALAGLPAGSRLEVVVEPTGPGCSHWSSRAARGPAWTAGCGPASG